MPWPRDTQVKHMKKKVELPVSEPVYSTYQYQGSMAGLLRCNPSLRNWYLNHALMLRCNRKFLTGYTTPEVDVVNSSWKNAPEVTEKRYSSEHLDGHIHYAVRSLLNDGYYVYYTGLDDFYIPGKSWYHEQHFYHDGLICGYDQTDKTYSLYAYDSSWLYRVFQTPQSAFNRARAKSAENGHFYVICGMKPSRTENVVEPECIYKNLLEYLDASPEKYPVTEDGPCVRLGGTRLYRDVRRQAVRRQHPYERMDRRVFRMLWEHKKVMLERLTAAEHALGLRPAVSTKYSEIVREANAMRMLYASHHMRRRDCVLPGLQKKLLRMREAEEIWLREFTEAMKGAMKSEAVESHQAGVAAESVADAM